ncbi:MAG: hypothetical protein Q9M17_09630 [Mariprofundus sp.]|nr:hypothetical protein [Mariprofundus sp.]
MHLSIQTDAQQRAELLVQAWAKKADVQVHNIRYHLLRNALILKDIHTERGGDSITIKHILLRTSPESLNSPKPQIGQVEISGIEAELHQNQVTHTWQLNQSLMQIWQAASSLQVRNGHLALHLKQHDSTPLVLENIFIMQHLQSQTRMIIASASLQHGLLQWQLHTDRVSNESDGLFSWKRVNTQQLTDALALQPMGGQLDGELTWQQSGAGQQYPLNIQGETLLSFANTVSNNSADPGNKQPLHRLRFSAAQQTDAWSIDMDASAWPLAAWSSLMPGLGERQLTAGHIDGSTHWQGVPGGWVINGSKGAIRDIVFAVQGDDKYNHSTAWSWNGIDYDSFHVDTKQQYLHVSRMALNDGKMTLNTERDPTAAAQQAPQKAALSDLWNISIDDIQVHNMIMDIKLPDGDITLQSLTGQGAWPKRHDLSFDLATDKLDSSLDPKWRLRGNVRKNEAMHSTDAEFTVHARDIPITSMRPLLPLRIDDNSPVTLTGKMDMRSKVSVQQGIWRMQGKASATDVQVSHAGDVWMADHITTRFGPVGMNLDMQHIDQIKVEQWLYLAALEPLQPVHQEQVIVPVQTAWWAAALRNKGIRIDQLRLQDGTLSVGQKESRWAKHFDIQIDNLGINSRANVKAKADVGGGLFELSGQWSTLTEPQRFMGSVSLHHASPFFLHSWMLASGMPRLLRGHLDLQLDIIEASEPDSYQSRWTVQLQRALSGIGNDQNDPMLVRTGYNTHDLIQHLGSEREIINLENSIAGSWQQRPLNFAMIEQSFLNTLYDVSQQHYSLQELSHQHVLPQKPIKPSLPAAIGLNTQTRLHNKKGVLSLNERSRLIKVVRYLRTKPEMSIDLIPRWSGERLDDEMLARILHTQHLIKRYMVHRKIDENRIFPLWPANSDHDQEISSIQIKLNAQPLIR